MEVNPFSTPLQDMLSILVYAAIALGILFLILSLVRLWGIRTQKRGGACGNVDLARLRRQMMAGTIRPEEYEAVRRALAGAAGQEATPPSASDGQQPIQPDEDRAEQPAGDDATPVSPDEPKSERENLPAGNDGETSERSRTDGET